MCRGRVGARRWEVDWNPAVGKWQPEEFSPPGGDLLVLAAWAGEEPGSRGRVTGINRYLAESR